MADLPVPRSELTGPAVAAATDGPAPQPVLDLMETLWRGGHSAYVVGGSLRDWVLRREPEDWDLATDALPVRVQELFASAVYENAFGTVGVQRAGVEYEITTLRRDHEYADHRRPHRVEFTDSIEEDLARRDFTVNAMAWGGPVAASGAPPIPAWVDPFHGAADIEARLLRAVGDPRVRFEEDALRMIRAVRLAATLDFAIEPATLAAIREKAPLAVHLSGERIATELERLLRARRPSAGLRLLEETGLLQVIAPELARQPGIPQNKIPGGDLWAHTLRSVDAAPVDRPVVRWAALVHDIGKPATLKPDGHFFDHETVGASLAGEWLATLRLPHIRIARVRHLVAQHMFSYESNWSDAAVRRFLRRIGVDNVDDLLALRAADNVGSGIGPDAGRLPELRRRIDEQLSAQVALDLRSLAVNGDDIIRECGAAPGPTLGRVLDELLEAVIADSALNQRTTLLELACAKLGAAS